MNVGELKAILKDMPDDAVVEVHLDINEDVPVELDSVLFTNLWDAGSMGYKDGLSRFILYFDPEYTDPQLKYTEEELEPNCTAGCVAWNAWYPWKNFLTERRYGG